MLKAAVVAATLAAVPIALNQNVMVRHYDIASPKIHRRVRFALLTDLHSCYYGPRQATLLQTVESQTPDIVLLGGDIADDQRPYRNALLVVEALAKRYPTYYVVGNHEQKSGDYPKLKKIFTAMGAHILQGECLPLCIKGQALHLCGVEDPWANPYAFLQQIDACKQKINPYTFNLLLTHRPEYAHWYAQCGFDLVATGHAHGGVWRVPGLINGVFASGQGIFPKYAGGVYKLGGTQMLVSRGLTRESTPIPRIFNRPEVVIGDIVPQQSKAPRAVQGTRKALSKR